MTLHNALIAARADRELYETHFATPTAIAAGAEAAQQAAGSSAHGSSTGPSLESLVERAGKKAIGGKPNPPPGGNPQLVQPRGRGAGRGRGRGQGRGQQKGQQAQESAPWKEAEQDAHAGHARWQML